MVKLVLIAALMCMQQADAKLTAAKDSQNLLVSVNPIRRVVTMLQSMQKKVAEEGEKEKALFEKFMCYCKNGEGQLSASIASATNTNEQLESSIKETDATLKQMKADLKTAQTDRADAKAAVAKATALREKEAAAYAKESGDLKTDIAALAKATAAIEKGMSGAFFADCHSLNPEEALHHYGHQLHGP
jgi:chromosome segregation ATPase